MKKFNKILILAILLLVVSLLSSLTLAADKTKIYIPVISKGFQHQFWQAVKLGSEKAAKEFDVTITFEGPEGSGKSSQITLLAEFLQDKGFPVLATREPGGTRIGDQVRDTLHDVANTEMVAPAEFLLYSASRAQLVRQRIQPTLDAGGIVLCDRYADSTIAYQGYGRGLNLDDVRQITRFATGGLTPDLTFLLDIDVERGLARRVEGAAEMNRLDLEEIAFHQRVRDGYHQLAKLDPPRWLIVDADRAQEIVQEELREILSTRVELPNLRKAS